MRIALLVGDGYTSYLLSRRLIGSEDHPVVKVLLSTRYRRSVARTFKIARGKSLRWLAYRSFVALKSLLLGIAKGTTVARASAEHGIVVEYTASMNETLSSGGVDECDLALAINLDQVLSSTTLAAFPRGVVNVHASRLPADRGVSPALWAFARGDTSVWASFYRMDEGLDSGPIFRQIEIPICEFRSAVGMYEHVCAACGDELPTIIDGIADGTLWAAEQSQQPGSYNGVPDSEFDAHLRCSGRHMMTLADIADVLVVDGR